MRKYSIFRDRPIPSCTVSNLIWDEKNKKWIYEYLATLPDKVTIDENGNFSKELYVYGHIQQLKLVSSVTKNSINIKVRSISDLEKLMDEQYKADIEYRKKWIRDNPDYYENLYEVEFENKTQKSKYSHIIFVKEQLEDKTVFVVAPEKGVK